MDTSELTLKILDIFPNVTFKTDTKHGNIRVHFKADTHNFVPSKWLFCNALELPEDKVSVSMKGLMKPDGIVMVNYSLSMEDYIYE